MSPVGLTGDVHYRHVDIDGDGHLDLLRQPSVAGEALESNGFARAEVNFTRRFAANQTYTEGGDVRGPALFPFTMPITPAYSVSSHASFQAEADLNGDGIPDLITAVNGENAEVRLGDGRGGFGCDDVHDVACVVPGNGSWLGPAYHLFFPDATTPWPLQQDSPFYFGVPGGSHRVHFFSDVTGDGLNDLIAFTPSSLVEGAPEAGKIQLWINVGGHTFRCATGTDCVVATVPDVWTAPGFASGQVRHRIVITDIDANGTQDFVLIGATGMWTFPFLTPPSPSSDARAPRAGLLTRIDNGVGAVTEITYETIQELERAAKANQTSFQRPWDTHVPTVAPIVTRITTRDTATPGGTTLQPFFVHRVKKYEYHDPAYDPWERSFKGFAIVRAIESSTNEVEQSWFYFGACERGPFVDPACTRGSDGGYWDASENQRVYPEKALAGALVRVDRFIPGSPGNNTATKWLTTTTTAYDLDDGDGAAWIKPSADPSSGRREREVTWARPRRVDTYLYDPTIEVSVVESISDPRQPQYAPAQAGAKRLRVDTTYDDQGNVATVTRFGRVAGSGGELSEDDKIVTRFRPTANRCGSNWACRVATVEVADVPLVEGVLATSERLLRWTHYSYSPEADLDQVSAALFTVGQNTPNTLERSGYGVGAPVDTVLAAAGTADSNSAPSTSYALRTFEHDSFGNVTRVGGMGGANQACTSIDYDTEFAQFPHMVSAFKAGGCTGSPLRTEHVFDRGLAAETATLHPDSTMETFAHDPFGRLSKVYVPVANGGDFATELSVQIWHYTQAPLSYVKVRRQVGTTPDDFIESIDIMNGVGEHALGFDSADLAVDGASWIARDWTERDYPGRPVITYRPWFTASDPDLVATTAVPPAPTGNMLFTKRDPFGRAIEQHDGAVVVGAISHLPLEIRTKDAEQLKASGPFVGWESVASFDGHGRVTDTFEPGSDYDWMFTKVEYLGTGEPTSIKRNGAFTVRTNQRFMTWDSYGRMTENHEPNTNGSGTGWRYVYDAEGRVVGTSDARGCGKNLYYDALGRLLAEDFSPCLPPPLQPAHSPPDLVTGDGTEAFFKYDNYEAGQVEPTADFDHRERLAVGRLVSIRDRSSHTRLSYDDRGRIRRVGRRIVKPGEPATSLDARYAGHWFKQDSTFDLGDRLVKRTTGLDEESLLVAGQSFETMAYSRRGALREVGSSYGAIVSGLTYTATGLPTHATYGDAASTQDVRVYDDRERPWVFQTFRTAAPPIWSAPTAQYPAPGGETTQLDLTWLEFAHDDVDNPTAINDISTGIWPDGAKKLSRSYEYDAAYRVKKVTYGHGLDPHVSPYEAEALTGDRRPIAERPGFQRIQEEQFWYDAHGNIDQSDDNEHIGFDRSLGVIWNGWTSAGGIAGGPHQMLEASSSDSTTTAAYDFAGNLTMLTVNRGSCSAEMPDCTHRFVYDWDEIGQLVRARRWDFPGGEAPAFDPNAPPAWDLQYAHGAGGRTLTTKTSALGETRHTLEVFDTLRVASVSFSEGAGEYVISDLNEVGFVGGIGRVFYDRQQLVPMPGATPLHVYLTIGDHLGSTAFVIDKDSGEVVERTQHQAFGKVESDYRPARWASNREDYKFTGKEEDIEVGATYFGARFYSPHVGRWLSPDPLTIHALGADPNPYAYVGGRVSSFIDPFGLEGCGGPPGTLCEDVIAKGPPRGSPARIAQLIAQGKEMAAELLQPALREAAKRQVDNIPLVHNYRYLRKAGETAKKPGAAKRVVRGAVRHHARKVVEMACRFCPRLFRFDPESVVTAGGRDDADELGADIDEGWFEAAGAAATAGAAAASGAAASSSVVGVLRARALQLGGFAENGLPIILDENVTAQGVAEQLRAQGYNVRTVVEIFGQKGLADPVIRQYAEVIGARVLTADRGRQLGQGFGQLAIRVPGQVGQDVNAISRILSDALR